MPSVKSKKPQTNTQKQPHTHSYKNVQTKEKIIKRITKIKQKGETREKLSKPARKERRN